MNGEGAIGNGIEKSNVERCVLELSSTAGEKWPLGGSLICTVPSGINEKGREQAQPPRALGPHQELGES